jgi:hypothetical protein
MCLKPSGALHTPDRLWISASPALWVGAKCDERPTASPSPRLGAEQATVTRARLDVPLRARFALECICKGAISLLRLRWVTGFQRRSQKGLGVL